MTVFKIQFTKKAEDDFSHAFTYFETVQNKLGLKFENEIDNLTVIILRNPFLFQIRNKHFREPKIKKFPYVIVYSVKDDTITIEAVFHSKRSQKSKYKK